MGTKNGKFPTDKWRFDKTDPHCSLTLSKSNVYLLIYCKLKINFTAKSQLLYVGCLLTRECKQKKNPISIFRSVRIRLRESVCLRECVSTEFDWKVNWGFEKASVSRAVRLRESPLADSLLYFIYQLQQNQPCSGTQLLRKTLAATYLLLVCVFPNCSSRLSYQSWRSFLAFSRHSSIASFSSLSILLRSAAFSSLHFLIQNLNNQQWYQKILQTNILHTHTVES